MVNAIRDRILELRRVPASELRANPRNWRRHPEGQKAALRGILSEVGIAGAVIARITPDGLELVDGHLRQDIAGDEMIPVLVTDLTEEEGDKVITTFDVITGMADVDKEKLAALLAQIRFDDGAVNGMLDELARESKVPGFERQGNTDPEATPDLPAVAVTQPGDLWLLGEHRLMCGDATSAKDVSNLLAGAKPMMMVTDPPYGVEYDPAWRAEAGVNENKKKLGTVANDDRADWREAWALFPGTIAYVWHAGLHAGVVHDSLTACDLAIRSQIIWAKDRFALSRGDYHWQHEPCWYAVREGNRSHTHGDRSQSTLWTIPAREDDGHGHGTQKPVECMERPIRNHDAAEIYEPFCGSGTTIIAATRQNRRCYAMELDPNYVDVAVKRWEEYTGEKAERISA